MKNILIIIFTALSTLLFAQRTPINLNQCSSYTEVPLRTYEIPQDACYYLKDTNNELLDYTGTWIGTWNNKKIYITFAKVSAYYDDFWKYNRDILVAKFKVVNINGGVLFDNTNLSDGNTKIWGGKFIKDENNNYSLRYVDRDLCNIGGRIVINFSNSNKTQINWKYTQDFQAIYPNCQYYGSANFPDPLPRSIILTKQ